MLFYNGQIEDRNTDIGIIFVLDCPKSNQIFSRTPELYIK